MKRAKFVLRKTEHGWYFNLEAPNGEVISTSEMYESKAAAEKGYRSVITNSATASVEVVEPTD